MKKFCFILIVLILISQAGWAETLQQKMPDRLGVSMIGSDVRNYRYTSYTATTAIPNALSWNYNTTVHCTVPLTLTLDAIQSAYMWDGGTGMSWAASSQGLTSPHSFTATFDPPQYALDPGPITLHVWGEDTNGGYVYIAANLMISDTAPQILYVWPTDIPSPGSMLFRQIVTHNVPISASLPAPYEQPAVGLIKGNSKITTTMYSTVNPGFAYSFQMDLPSTMATGDWLLYMLYDYLDFRYAICKTFPIIDNLVYPGNANLTAPPDGSVVPPGNVTMQWNYTDPITPCGFELHYGSQAFSETVDLPYGSNSYTETITNTAQTFNWSVVPYIDGPTRTYPLDPPQVWDFSTWNPAPPPAPPIPPSGGSTTLNGGATGYGAGSTISITPTGNLPTQPIIVTQTDPVTLGVPFPENALDLAFTIETDGTLSDPITIKIEWDFPEPTPPTSGSPTLIVNHGDGWNNHPVDAWDYTAPPYWVEFSTGQLSDWVIGEGDDNPLPVTLSAFTGLCYEGIPTLNWTTQSETDNLGWNIFRSLSENGWNSGEIFQINSNLIAGQGTTTEITTYTYQDIYDILQNVEYHYWLQSISLGGDIGIYGPVSVLVELEEEPIIVPELPVTTFMNHNYPNPFNPQTTIEFGIKEGETGTFAIYNLRGQKIMSQNFAEGYHTYHWNAEKLSSGIYFYVLKTFSYREVKRMILLK